MTTPLAIRLTIEPFPNMDDFFALRREQHDAREWEEKSRYGSRYCRSDRLVPQSDVEGAGYEWQTIAFHIRNKQECSFKRVAVVPQETGWLIWSPRQSGVMEPVLIDDASAQHLAGNIERVLGVLPWDGVVS